MQLEAVNISFKYPNRKEWVLNDVSMAITPGERVALVGPSGCGKSTLAKILAGYMEPVTGKVLLDGKPLPRKEYCPVQMVCQHPELSINPRHKMSKILYECWVPGDDVLNAMGIEKEWLNRWPGELSGGELQRFCIARVLSPQTKLLICDEISAMLDVITQAQIWELLLDIALKNNLSLIVVTHNMDLAKKVCERTIEFSDINRAKILES